MGNNTAKQIKAGAIISYLQMFLSIIVGLAYTPVMIRLLGQSEYGLYNTVSSTISMLSVLSLGFNGSYIRFYSIYKKNDDKDSIYKLNGLFLIIFIIIGIIALLCGLFLSFNLDLVFKDGLTSKEYQTARILMLLLTANLTLMFPMSVFSTIISAHERFVFLKLLGIIKTVASPLVALPLLLIGYKSIAIVSVTVLLSLIVDITYIIFVLVKLKQKFIFRNLEKGLFKNLFVFTLFIAINLIVDQINLNIDKLLLARFQGTTAVAVYSVGFLLQTYYQLFSTSISGVFAPRIHGIVNATTEDAVERKRQLSELFIKVGRIQFLLLALVASGFVFFGQSFIYFWAGDGYESAYYVALLLILPLTIPLIQNLGVEIQRAENKHKFRSIVYLFMAMINLIFTIFLCQKYGVVGAAVGTAISLVVANGIIMNIYYHKKCDINILKFWKNIGRMCLGLIIPIICGILIKLFIEIHSVWMLLLLIIAYCIVYVVSMWFLGINSYEKNLLKMPLKKLFRNKNVENNR